MMIRRPSAFSREMYHIGLLFIRFYGPKGVLERLGGGYQWLAWPLPSWVITYDSSQARHKPYKGWLSLLNVPSCWHLPGRLTSVDLHAVY